MAVFGWIMLIIFALLGLAIIGFLLYEFAVTQIRLMNARIGAELAIMREDIKIKSELKKARLAKKREAHDTISNLRIDAKIKEIQNEIDGNTQEEKKHHEEKKHEAPTLRKSLS